MKTKDHGHHERVLAIYPVSRGFGYALFEGPREPMNWGVRTTRKSKNKLCVAYVKKLITFNHPDVLVIEDRTSENSLRKKRVNELLASLEALASESGIGVVTYSPTQVHSTFELFNATTKYERAEFIESTFSTIKLPLPTMRKMWLPESYGMAVYDAISLVLTYYYLES